MGEAGKRGEGYFTTPPPQSQRYLAEFRSIFDGHSWEESVPPSPKMEARDPADHFTTHRTAPDTNNYLVQNVNSAIVENSCSFRGNQHLGGVRAPESLRTSYPDSCSGSATPSVSYLDC